MSILTTIVSMNTMRYSHNLTMERINTTSSYSRRRKHSEDSTSTLNSLKNKELVFDVMKSKYSKVVLKTYKTRKGAENYCIKNGLDVACVKSRWEEKK